MVYREEDKKYLIRDTCDPELKKVLMKIIYDDNVGGTHDLSYEICAQACEAVSDFHSNEDYEELQDYLCDNGDFASYLIFDRLAYLNIGNQDEVTEILKENNCNIEEASAIWYDQKISEVATFLDDWHFFGKEESELSK